jgi:hypothetical protein
MCVRVSPPVVVWFKGSGLAETQVFALLIRQLCEVGIKCWQVGEVVCLTHLFGQKVDVLFISSLWGVVKLYQSQGLSALRYVIEIVYMENVSITKRLWIQRPVPFHNAYM